MQKSALSILLVVELLFVSIDVVAMGCPWFSNSFQTIRVAWSRGTVIQRCGNFLNDPELLDTNAKLKKVLEEARDVGVLERFLVHRGDSSPRKTLLMQRVFADKSELGHACTKEQIDTLIDAAKDVGVLKEMLQERDECGCTVLDQALFMRCSRNFCRILEAAVDAGVLDALISQSIQRRGRDNFLTFITVNWSRASSPYMTNAEFVWRILSIVERGLTPERFKGFKKDLLVFAQTCPVDPAIIQVISLPKDVFCLNK